MSFQGFGGLIVFVHEAHVVSPASMTQAEVLSGWLPSSFSNISTIGSQYAYMTLANACKEALQDSDMVSLFLNQCVMLDLEPNNAMTSDNQRTNSSVSASAGLITKTLASVYAESKSGERGSPLQGNDLRLDSVPRDGFNIGAKSLYGFSTRESSAHRNSKMIISSPDKSAVQDADISPLGSSSTKHRANPNQSPSKTPVRFFLYNNFPELKPAYGTALSKSSVFGQWVHACFLSQRPSIAQSEIFATQVSRVPSRQHFYQPIACDSPENSKFRSDDSRITPQWIAFVAFVMRIASFAPSFNDERTTFIPGWCAVGTMPVVVDTSGSMQIMHFEVQDNVGVNLDISSSTDSRIKVFDSADQMIRQNFNQIMKTSAKVSLISDSVNTIVNVDNRPLFFSMFGTESQLAKIAISNIAETVHVLSLKNAIFKRFYAASYVSMFMTRLPMTTWDKVSAYDFQSPSISSNSLRLAKPVKHASQRSNTENMDVTSSSSSSSFMSFNSEDSENNRPKAGITHGPYATVLGKGTYGTVVKMEWIFDDDISGHKLQRAEAPGVKSMGIINELDSYIATMSHLVSKQNHIGGDENLTKSKIISSAERLSLHRIGIILSSHDDNTNRERSGSSALAVDYASLRAKPILDVEMFLPSSIAQTKRLDYVANFYTCCVVFARRLRAIIIRSDQEEMTILTQDRSKMAYFDTIDVNASVAAAYQEFVRQSIHILTEGTILSTANDQMNAWKIITRTNYRATMPSKPGSILLHCRAMAAMKISHHQDIESVLELEREAFLMEYLSCFYTSPKSVDSFYGALKASIPMSLQPISRNDINQSIVGNALYIPSVSPEDRSLNPRCVIQANANSRGIEMVVVDDDGSVIASHPIVAEDKISVNAYNMDSRFAWHNARFGFSSIEMELPAAQRRGTFPSYGTKLHFATKFDFSSSSSSPSPSYMLMPFASKGTLDDVLTDINKRAYDLWMSFGTLRYKRVSSVVRGSSENPPTNLYLIIRMLKQVLGGLAFCNNQGISHNDVTSRNILVNANQAMLSDFGLAITYGKVAMLGTRTYLPSHFDKLPSDAAYNETSLASSTVVKDCIVDRLMFGRSMLWALFGQDGPDFGAKPSLEKLSPFLFTAIPTDFMAVFGCNMSKTDIEYYCKSNNIIDENAISAVSDLTMPIAEWSRERMPMSPEMAEFALRQLHLVLHRMAMITKEENNQMYEDKAAISDGIYFKIPSDNSMLGYSPEWYTLDARKKRMYGFINDLKMAEAVLTWLLHMIELDQDRLASEMSQFSSMQ